MTTPGTAARRRLIRVSRWTAVVGALVIAGGISGNQVLIFVGALIIAAAMYLGYAIGREGG